MRVTLKETTVGALGDVSVGCGNFHDDAAYPLPDGSVKVGRTATLAPFDRSDPLVVGAGSEVAIGGRTWRVVSVTKAGPLGTVTLEEVQAGPVLDGIDFGAADLRTLVARQLTGSPVGSVRADDRTPIDWLKRIYKALRERHPELADRLSRAIAHHLGTADPEVDGLIIRFFTDVPTAAGGERLAALAASALDRYDAGLPDPTPGSVTDRLRESLLRAALRWRDGAGLPPEVLDAAKDAVHAGEGRHLVADLARLDPTWANERLPQAIALYPGASSTFFRAFTRAGMSADEALALVLPHADAHGRGALADNIRWTYRDDPATRDRLLARL